MNIRVLLFIMMVGKFCPEKMYAQHKDTFFVRIGQDSSAPKNWFVTRNAIFADCVSRSGQPNDWIDSMGYSGIQLFLGRPVSAFRSGPITYNPFIDLYDLRDSLKKYTSIAVQKKLPTETLNRNTKGSFLAKNKYVLVATYRYQDRWIYRLITDIWYFYRKQD